MLPQAVIFDVDGLLIDTETCDYHSWRELHEEVGVPLTPDEYCYSAGLYGSWERMYAELAGRCGETEAALHERRSPRFKQMVAELLRRPNPDLLNLLDTLHAHGVRTGVASSSDADWVKYLLEGLGIRSRFEAVVTGDDVERRKPAPDVYRLVTERMGVAPGRCVALEDSSHGITAAKAAGLRAVAVPNHVSSRQDLSHADVRVTGLEKVTLTLLQNIYKEAPGA